MIGAVQAVFCRCEFRLDTWSGGRQLLGVSYQAGVRIKLNSWRQGLVISPRNEETIERPGRDPTRRSARRLVRNVLVAGLALGAGVALGSATRDGSSPSNGQNTAAGAGATSPSLPGGASGGLDLSRIAAKVDPAIVDINTTLANNGGAAAGTGMVISASGEVTGVQKIGRAHV